MIGANFKLIQGLCSPVRMHVPRAARCFSTTAAAVKDSQTEPLVYIAKVARAAGIPEAAALTNTVLIEHLPEAAKYKHVDFHDAASQSFVASTKGHAFDENLGAVFEQALSLSRAPLVSKHGDHVYKALSFPVWNEHWVKANWKKNNRVVQAEGTTDAVIFSAHPLKPLVDFPVYTALDSQGTQSLEHSFERSVVKSSNNYDWSGWLSARKDHLLVNTVCSPLQHMPHPALSIRIEDGINDSAISEMLLYNATSTVAQAVKNSTTTPVVQFGVLTNGKRFVFTAFQLNTLCFDSNTDNQKNLFWYEERKLVSPSNKVDVTVLGQLYCILEQIYKAQVTATL